MSEKEKHGALPLEIKRICSFGLFLFSFQILILSPLFINSLNSTLSRILLLVIFFLPMVWIIHYSRKGSGNWVEAAPALFLSFIGVPVFIYLLYNLYNFIPIFEGIAKSEVVLIAEEYQASGSIVRSSPHSYFFQTPYIAYVLSSICNVPLVYAVFMEQICVVIVLALLSMYLSKIIASTIAPDRFPLSLFPYLTSFSFIASGTRIWVPGMNMNYRDIGSYIMLIFLSYLFKRGFQTRRDYIIILMLVVGATLGSPPAAMLTLLIFAFYTFFEKHIGYSIFIVVPLFYLTSSATLYFRSLRSYFIYAIEGFIAFFIEIFRGTLPEVLPTGRTPNPYGDKYLETVAYLSLLAIGGFLIIITKLTRSTNNPSQREASQFRTIFYVVFLSLCLAVLVTVGVSVMPETSFSDVRSIVVIFMSLTLPFFFALKKTYTKIRQWKIGAVFFFFGLTILIASSSLIKPAVLYPKSRHDIIYTLEDKRLDLTATGYAKEFLFQYYKKGTIYFDYKSRQIIFAGRLFNRSYVSSDITYSVYDISKLNNLEGSLAFFDKHGLVLPSFYVSQEEYNKTYNYCLDANIIYDDGGIIIGAK